MITRQQVIEAVCEEYGLSEKELLKPTQQRPICQARQVAAMVLHEAGWSWQLVANTLHYGDPATPARSTADLLSPNELQSVRMMVGLIPGWPAIEMLPARLESVE